MCFCLAGKPLLLKGPVRQKPKDAQMMLVKFRIVCRESFMQSFRLCHLGKGGVHKCFVFLFFCLCFDNVLLILMSLVYVYLLCVFTFDMFLVFMCFCFFMCF